MAAEAEFETLSSQRRAAQELVEREMKEARVRVVDVPGSASYNGYYKFQGSLES